MDQQLSTQILEIFLFKARFGVHSVKNTRFLKVLCKSLQVTGAENAALTHSLLEILPKNEFWS